MMKDFPCRFLFMSGIAVPLLGIYLLINHREGVEHSPVTMPDWIPFCPGMALPYLLMLILPLFLQMLIRDRTRFHQSLLAVVIGFVMISAIWIFYPTTMTRPELGKNSQAVVYQLMVGVDRPVNIFPCGHVLWPLVAGFFLGRERPAWLTFLIPLFLFGTVTITTSWQHRPVDILVGMVIALSAIWIATRMPYPGPGVATNDSLANK